MSGIEHLNDDCTCRTLDTAALSTALTATSGDPEFFKELIATHPHLVSAQPVFLTPAHAQEMASTIEAIETVAALPAYRSAVLTYAPAIARFEPGPAGVFMGYDFHLGATGPMLIEVNTNAGGALLNAYLARAQRACCEEMELGLAGRAPIEGLSDGFLSCFVGEWRRQGREHPLSTIAIVDANPGQQYLYPEFVLFMRQLGRQGLKAVIAAPSELSHRDGALWHRDLSIDLVYNRLTDFNLAEESNAALRSAYLAGDVVVTPNPRVHALLANKRNLAPLTDPALLRSWGVPEPLIEQLRAGIPRTVEVGQANAEALWSARAGKFFKPAAGYGSKAAYRGDKITRKVWNHILASDYVAQDLVPPSTRQIAIDDRRETLKVDFRNFTYQGRVLLLAARVYQGQTTNFRTAGGGFAPVFVGADASCPAHHQPTCVAPHDHQD